RLDLTPSARPASGTGPRALCTTRCEATLSAAHCEARRMARSETLCLLQGTGPRALCPIRCRGDALHGHCEAHCEARHKARLKVSAPCKAATMTPGTAQADVHRQASSKPPLRAQRVTKLSARP